MTERKKGTVIKTKSGLWQGVITLSDGRRKRLPPFERGTSRKMAEEHTAYAAEHRDQLEEILNKRKPAAPAVLKPADSNEPWFKAWIADRVARKYTAKI